MTLIDLFTAIAEYKIPLTLLLLGTPWITYLLCFAIPGKQEEPYLLSFNLTISVIGMLLLAGHLAYAMNTGGWQKIIGETELIWLFLPPYHLITSIWLTRQRLPLALVPAFRTLQGLIILAGIFLVFSWLASKIHLVIFSRMPFSNFLALIAILLAVAYFGYRRLVNR